MWLYTDRTSLPYGILQVYPTLLRASYAKPEY